MTSSAETGIGLEDFCRDATLLSECSGEQLFAISPDDVNKIHLATLNKRLAELAPLLPPLKVLAQENGINGLSSIDEVVPLLFPHTTYKSYPLTLIDNCRFSELNGWLNDYTVHDLSGLDVSACESLDDWLTVVERDTPIRVLTSSGTSGKISLLPRSLVEEKFIPRSFAVVYGKYRNEVGIANVFGPNVYHVLPYFRRGRHSQNRSIQARVTHGFGGDESHVLSYEGEMSTDVLWLTGRLKKAQSDGKIEQLKKTKAWQRLSRKLEAQVEKKAESEEAFFLEVLTGLKGKTVAMALGFPYYAAMVNCAKKHHLEITFAADSFLASAGGLKGVSMTAEEIDAVKQAVGFPLQELYGCSEIMSFARKCPAGHFHMPPTVINFVLDPETGEPYPREGVQTGRYAAFDLLATTYWGGLITGDEVTIDWNGGCSCGRNGPFMHGTVMRYTDKHGGDDKITCQRTAAAVAEMHEYIANN